jgi:putative DNA primase/helicase
MIHVPADLSEYKQWVLWRRAEINGRIAKIPVSPWSGKAAACDKPETWSTFRYACTALKRLRADGLGFVFTATDPFCGIDLDKCRGKDGLIEENSLQLIREMGSYAEISPSGNGVHIIIKAKLSSAGRRTAGLEVYASGRYFTMTGKHLSGTPETIQESQRQLENLVRSRFSPDLPSSSPGSWEPNDSSDSGLIEKAFAARSGPRFRKLWSGDTSDYEGDHSRADAALCRMLSFWTGNDTERIDRLFRMSGLMREKWNRRTGQETYGARTIRISSRH